MSEIAEKIRQLSLINQEITQLNEERKKLEAWFLERGSEDVADTKFKSLTYVDPKGPASVTYTEARSLSVNSPNYLKSSLGDVFKDVFEEKTKIEIKPKSKEIERMLIGIFTGEVVRTSPEEIIAELPCPEKAKIVLSKKLKGAKFEADRDNLKKIGGFDEEDANDYAFLYAEAVVYKTFCRICEMSNISQEKLMQDIMLAVSVDDTTKLTVNNGDEQAD